MCIVNFACFNSVIAAVLKIKRSSLHQIIKPKINQTKKNK